MLPNLDADITIQDPSTRIQQPSSNKVPDTTHVLANTFGYIRINQDFSIQVFELSKNI
jgi:hypothetical protein